VLPNWADDIDDVTGQIRISHGETINTPNAGGVGDSVHIGIIDSAWKAPLNIMEQFDIRGGPENAFIDPNQESTVGHCSHVFAWTSAFCPGATFSLYQAVDEDKSLPLDAFSEAVTKAIEDQVDIINISAGDPWRGPVNANPAVQEVKRAIDEDITVVAAAGNYDPEEQDTRPPVHCPAAHDPVIAVGAMEVNCPIKPGKEPADQGGRPYYCIPEKRDDLLEVRPTENAFCGQQGCVNGESCIRNQNESEWDYNPLQTDNKPDIFAPMHRPIKDANGDHLLKVGTSFAAPIVTASLGCIYSELHDMGQELPRPHEARDAVINGGFPIGEGPHNKYDAMATRGELGIL